MTLSSPQYIIIENLPVFSVIFKGIMSLIWVIFLVQIVFTRSTLKYTYKINGANYRVLKLKVHPFCYIFGDITHVVRKL